MFQQNSVCFGCFNTGLKHQNKPKKRFLVSRNKPKNNRNRLSFGLFRFEPKKKFDCFEDTLVGRYISARSYSHVACLKLQYMHIVILYTVHCTWNGNSNPHAANCLQNKIFFMVKYVKFDLDFIKIFPAYFYALFRQIYLRENMHISSRN